MTRKGLVAGVAAVLLAVAVPALAAGGGRRVVGDCDRSQLRPSTVWISCNNPSFSFTALHWRSFGGAVASASGLMRLESCPRACDPSDVHDYPVALTFSDARPCPDGRDDYRLVLAAYTSSARPPGGPAKPYQLVLFCPLSN
jgi:hypothetical protein